VVSISGREEAQAAVSPAIEALIYCAAPVLQEEGDPQKCVRLVVPSSQVMTNSIGTSIRAVACACHWIHHPTLITVLATVLQDEAYILQEHVTSTASPV